MELRFIFLFLILFYSFYSYSNESSGDNGLPYSFCLKINNEILQPLNFKQVGVSKPKQDLTYILLLQDNSDVDFDGGGLSFSSAALYILNGGVYKVDATLINTVESNLIKDSVFYFSENKMDNTYLHGLFYASVTGEGQGLYKAIMYVDLY